ncbi:AAA family ATPase [Pseudoalteromonas spongiae]|uniref:AAA family ATPase n=1 Tax=Pseudoalteromonas spongiae TaxID=298657 RepID=UPI000C2CF1E0|nr:ATP-binding protein [Pseudoalteromonas spongiae]
MNNLGNLTFFCGKMGAGKSTQAKLIAKQTHGVLISEDEWLSAHFPEQIKSFDDYIHYANLIKPFVKTHVQRMLATGSHVVMDFPANTVKQRAWLHSLSDEINGQHKVIYLDVSNATCLAQIAKRRISEPERSHFDTEAMFHHVTQYFEPPKENEGLNIVLNKNAQ